MRLGHVALDGSKVQANASKHKAMTYERMAEEEKRLSLEIEELLERARTIDQEEDERLGVEETEEDIPAELARRESRLARIREAKAALEQDAARARAEKLRRQAEEQQSKADDALVDRVEQKRARTRAEKARAQADQLEPSPDPTERNDGWPHHRVPANVDGTPRPHAQRNFTDSDSRIMLKEGAYLQAYNAQVVVDEHAQVIVAEGVSNQAPDQQHLVPMLRDVFGNCGDAPRKMTADNGYLSDQHRILRQQSDRCPHRCWTRTEPRRVDSVLISFGAHTCLARSQANARQVANARRQGGLRPQEEYRRTGARTDQSGTRIPPVLATLLLQGTSRGDARLPHPQPAQALPIEARDRRERLTQGSHLQIGTRTGTGTRTGVA